MLILKKALKDFLNQLINMRYREWKLWVKSKPWCLRWFIYLVLFRTIIDNFYTLKKLSPLFSPLYIIGVLTPVLIFISFNSIKFPRKEKSKTDSIMLVWGTIVFINLLLIFVTNISISSIGNLIKYFTPVFLFFYLRHFIRNKKDLIGIFQTFLYSIIFAILFVPYNYIFNPGAFRQISIKRGGGFRFAGGYADVMNYAILIIGGLLIVYFFNLRKSKKILIWRNLRIKSFFLFILSLAGLIAIKHTASWAVFFAITGIFILYLFRRIKVIIPILLVFLSFSVYFQGFISKHIDPLIQKEVSIIEGEADIDRSFNGRMWRWKRYFRVWDQMPVYSKLFGVTFSYANDQIVIMDRKYYNGFSKIIPAMVSGRMHNDYIRVLFLSGIVGLFFYLQFIFTIFRKKNSNFIEDSFLATSSLSVLLLFSVTTIPLLYSPLIYLIFSIFAYLSLPKKNRANNEK